MKTSSAATSPDPGAIWASLEPRAGPASRGGLLALALAVSFSNLPVWLNLFHLPSLTPVVWVGGVSVLAIVSVIWRRVYVVPVPVIIPAVIGGYMALNLISFALLGGGEQSVLFQRLLMLVLLLIAYLAFAADAAAGAQFQRLTAWVVVISVAANVYDITHPFSFVPSDSEFATLGRAAGLYANPNVSGAAIVLGTLIALPALRVRWRAAFMFAAMLGVVLTLSRAAMLGMAIVFMLMFLAGLLRGRDAVVMVLTAVVIASIVGIWALPVLEQISPVDLGMAMERILWVFDPTGRADFSQSEREYLAFRGWQQFVESPFWGNGIGSTETWAERSSTHNFFLMQMSDFGVLGLLLPLFIIYVALSAGARQNGTAVAFALFFLLWCVVSHNILSEMYWIIAIAWFLAASSMQHCEYQLRGRSVGAG